MDLSIIVVNYNYSSYIKSCIESCLLQAPNDVDYEVIVIDDGSDDNSWDIIKKIDHSRLKKFRIKNSGIEKATNFGYEKSKGDRIVRVDADDELCRNYLNEMAKYFYKDVDFVYPEYYTVDKNNNIIEGVELPEFNANEIYRRGDFLATGTIFTRKIFSKVGKYSEAIKNSGLENYQFILNILKMHGIGLKVSNKLFLYRVHQLSLSNSKREKIFKNGCKLFAELNLGEYGFNQYHPQYRNIIMELDRNE